MKKTSLVILAAAAISASAHAQQVVQWHAADGGNEHRYAKVGPFNSWLEAKSDAESRGAHLLTVTRPEEWHFVYTHIDPQPWGGAVLGGYQLPESHEPGIWVWITGEPWPAFLNTADFAGDCPGGPDGACASGCSTEHQQDYLMFGWHSTEFRSFDDVEASWRTDANCNFSGGRMAIIEWETDCNGNGTQDYLEILNASVPDGNGNGVPDVCECIGDILADRTINGADLGALLSYWGPVTASPISRACDLNGDGQVSGGDLGLLLSNWGSCPQ
jgi:hypothetical protein